MPRKQGGTAQDSQLTPQGQGGGWWVSGVALPLRWGHSGQGREDHAQSALPGQVGLRPTPTSSTRGPSPVPPPGSFSDDGEQRAMEVS